MADELLTDAQGQYRLNKFGSKERPLEGGGWVTYANELSAEEVASRSAAFQESQQRALKEATIRDLLKSHLRFTYQLAIYIDPRSSAAQKSNALTGIQGKLDWIEANKTAIQELLS